MPTSKTRRGTHSLDSVVISLKPRLIDRIESASRRTHKTQKTTTSHLFFKRYMATQHDRRTSICAFLSIFLPLLGLSSWLLSGSINDAVRRSETTTGRVSGVCLWTQTSNDQRHTWFKTTVEFEALNSTCVFRDDLLARRTIGSDIDVVYNPHNPCDASTAEKTQDRLLNHGVLVGLMLFVILFSIMCLCYDHKRNQGTQETSPVIRESEDQLEAATNRMEAGMAKTSADFDT